MQTILAIFGSAVFGLASELKSFDVYPNEPSRFHPYRNFSAALSQCGASKHLACDLQCVEHEQVLEDSFEHWWDHQLPWTALFQICERIHDRASHAYVGTILNKRVFYRCCVHECEASPLLDGVSEVDFLLSLVAELATHGDLPNMVFLFNTGDQPFSDKAYWSPIPQFHWVRSSGHWTVPLPNPFHLKAYAKNLLGDSLAHSQHHLPWSQKMPRIFWRGSLSAPDNFAVDDIASLPRVRLLNLAQEYPDLFDVGITSVDREIYKVAGVSNIESLLQRLGGKVKRKNFAREMPKYRYLINVAAVLSSWRLVDMLATKSVLLLQESWDHELIMEWLVPWEHYVPISPGLSDLIEKVQWLERNQDIAESIAERGFQRFSERVRRQDTLCYIWQAFQTLADVQTQATPEELQDRVSEMKEVKPKLAKFEKYGSASAISPVKDVKATEL